MANALRRFDGLLRNDPFYRSFFEGFDFPQLPSLAGDESQPGLLLPRMNVEEQEAAFKLTLEIPGMNKDDIHVEVDKGRLVVRGEKKEERSETREKTNVHVREIRYGSFERSFGLPGHVTADAVSASYDAGILAVRVAGVYAGTEPTRIEISQG